MLNNPLRTSLTRDEIVGNLLGWITGPCCYTTKSDDPNEAELLDSVFYEIASELENVGSQEVEACIDAKSRGDSPEILANLRSALDAAQKQEAKVPILLQYLDDELSKGENSMLRLDRTARHEPTPLYTIISVAEWAAARFGLAYTPGLDDPIDSRLPSDVQIGMDVPKVKPISNVVTKGTRPKGQMVRQEEAIIACIVRLGYTPTHLPPYMNDGTKGVHALVRDEIDGKDPFEKTTAFKHAWTRLLRNKKKIAYCSNP